MVTSHNIPENISDRFGKLAEPKPKAIAPVRLKPSFLSKLRLLIFTLRLAVIPTA
ncbi:hypothetical protein H6F90_06435 [Trichocoleus sp. FACHB-591]|uniref:hypothetical protein n=1 Tax=Trichocoleus sp. FACHB-591 TaxID=2692872 RepID=UPI001685382A|nr:hypothetical protein [Trichocoleus sp. FACHB-591]MBD2094788.1 hypothetical protein [Trichocoleus sp. FACHB-591]